MRIGGLQPVTLLDYPQKVAATIFTSGCNMRCPFCYNPNLVVESQLEKNGYMPETEIKEFLTKRKDFLDGVCITGGEPLIQPDLKEFLRWIKDLGYFIKLDTNGLLPDKIKELIDEGILDYVAMDIKGPLDNYEKFSGVNIDSGIIKDSIEIIKNGGIDYEFRSTIVKGLHTREDIISMAKAVIGTNKYFLQNFLSQDHLVGDNFKGESFTKAELRDILIEVKKILPIANIR